jgi:hypothetical protein
MRAIGYAILGIAVLVLIAVAIRLGSWGPVTGARLAGWRRPATLEIWPAIRPATDIEVGLYARRLLSCFGTSAKPTR